MPEYLLSVYQPDGPPPPPEVLGPVMRGVQAWETALKDAGSWVFTAGLHPAGAATVVRVSDGEMLTTDGPFAEGKEHVGGFTIITVTDLDAALGWASQLAGVTGLAVEVRPMRSESAPREPGS
ncbi:MAG TPA: YciI family protein [Streptosporangiaceae bacterium]|jgi:hypothetical protein